MAAAPIQLSSVLEYSLHIINGSVGCRTTGECNGSTPNHGLSESLSLTGKHDSYALTKSTGSVAQVWPYVEACLDGKVFDPSSLALEDLSTHARRGAFKLKGKPHQLPVVQADSGAEDWVQTLCLEYLKHVMMLAQAVLASQTPAPEHELIFDTFQGMVKTVNQHPTSDSDFQAPDVIVKVKLQPGANDQPQGAQVEIFRAEIKAITTECLRSLLEWVVAEGVRFDPCNGLSRKGPIASIPADQHETLSRMVAQGKQYSEQTTSPGTCLLTNLYSYGYLFTRADRGVAPVSTNLLEQVASRRDPDKPFEPDIHDRGMESHQRIFETLLAVFLHGLCRARPELFLDPDLRSRLDQIAPELQG
ncbi:protein kinase subdomain-containing protein PKL/ccin4 [Coprinopsis cinerea AmutBmut pab1-1]|nr:protein kinase subdomain-containing protein PKL/ccin4 [Coprinopsis cinerea AmutBmut pab1-1]